MNQERASAGGPSIDGSRCSSTGQQAYSGRAPRPPAPAAELPGVFSSAVTATAAPALAPAADPSSTLCIARAAPKMRHRCNAPDPRNSRPGGSSSYARRQQRGPCVQQAPAQDIKMRPSQPPGLGSPVAAAHLEVVALVQVEADHEGVVEQLEGLQGGGALRGGGAGRGAGGWGRRAGDSFVATSSEGLQQGGGALNIQGGWESPCADNGRQGGGGRRP